MKRLVISAYCLVLSALCTNVLAVPAWPGPHTRTLPDGTQQTYYVHGDEFFHWTSPSTEAIMTPEQEMRYAAAPHKSAHRMPAEIGTPYLPKKGLVILVNFKDVKFKKENTRAQMDSMCNGLNYTYGGAYKSAAQYFSDQSNGQYCPKFDVIGPVELDSCYAYYGKNNTSGNDRYMADVVIEACRRAKAQYPSLNFANYAQHKASEVDFVFLFYAGYGENETYDDDHDRLWPLQWTVDEACQYGYKSTRFTKDSAKIDGVKINMFAYTNELQYYNNDARCGIGTLCHEFGHVLGLADYYNTVGSSYYANIPNNWHIMCKGCYNDNGNLPPSYGPFEKFFFKWITPIQLQDSQTVTLPAGGNTCAYMTEHNTVWSTPIQHDDSTVFYFENRQQTGWDAASHELNGHGLLIWRVIFNKRMWEENTPNNNQQALRITIIPSSKENKIKNNNDDTYPGTYQVTDRQIFDSRSIVNIAENNGSITFTTTPQGITALPSIPDDRHRLSGDPYALTPKKYLLNNQIIISIDEKTSVNIGTGTLLRSGK